MATDRWYESSTDLRKFMVMLIDAEILEDTDDIKEFLNKPHRFNTEYKAWEDSGFVESDDAEWDDFVTSLSSDEEDAES